MKSVTKVVLLGLLSLLWGCTNNMKVTGTFPKPLIASLPQPVGIIYDNDFRNYVYTETSDDRGKWIIDAGAAQVDLFNTVIPELFDHVEELTAIPSADTPANVKLVLYPKIIDFQYSVPRETKFTIYEVWLKYNLSVYDAQGAMVADWILTAYGKTPTAFMQTDEDAMNAAIMVALRDLGANLSIGTRRVPEIRAWLERNTPNDPSLKAVQPIQSTDVKAPTVMSPKSAQKTPAPNGSIPIHTAQHQE